MTVPGDPRGALSPLEMWGGVECTLNRVHDRWFDQLSRSGHDTRVDDLDRFAALGIRAIRYPVLWERLAPAAPDQIDWRWSDARLGRLRDLGVRPIVGLIHHGSGPAYTSLVDRSFPEKLAVFARAVAHRYPWVTDFTPINEPLTTARFSGLYGHWYPHGRDDRTFVSALLTQIRGIVLAMRAIREVTPDARLIQTEDCGQTFGTSHVASQVAHEEHRRWLTWDLLSGTVIPGHPLYSWLLSAGADPAELELLAAAPCPSSIVGVNYYLTSDRYLDERVDRYPAHTRGGNGLFAYADVEAVRTRVAGIAGHQSHLVSVWERYRQPVAITEVHLACTREEQVRWLLEAWRAAHGARARGADIRAVTAWALLGSFDWNSLVTVDAGAYEPGAFDVRGAAPRATAVAAAVQALAAGREPVHPAFSGPGWWRRPERLVHGPMPSGDRTVAAGPPLLIFGASGTLGRAFERICATRGLRAHLVSRHDADITNPGAVDAVIRQFGPWAVVNAAGYVRVDEAETHRDACWRANVNGPVTLAAACRRRGLPFVTFSSAMVFDGASRRPYTENDQPNPRNVYGESHAAAERRVLELLPDALVVRTGACFDPWDQHSFLASVMRAIDSAEEVLISADTTVSPTYVPHLVDATLDLLIDGEGGLWHLANQGAVTWLEFARLAAARCGRPVDRIRAAPSDDVAGRAARPRYSALGSRRGMLLPPLETGLEAWLETRPDPRFGSERDSPSYDVVDQAHTRSDSRAAS